MTYTIYALMRRKTCVYVGCTRLDPAIRLLWHAASGSRLARLMGSDVVAALRVKTLGEYESPEAAREAELTFVEKLRPTMNYEHHIPYPVRGRFQKRAIEMELAAKGLK